MTVGIPYWAMWPSYTKVTYCMYIVLGFYISVVEKKQWQCRRQLRFLCGVSGSLELLISYPSFSFLLLLSLSLSLIIPGIEEDQSVWDSWQCQTVPDVPALPTFFFFFFFLNPLSWPFPHPSVPLLLFFGHRRKDMQIQNGREPNRLSRRPRLAHLFSILFLYFSFFCDNPRHQS